MSQYAAVAAVCGGYLQPIEIACAAVFCGGSAAVCGGLKKASEINARRFAAVGVEVTPIPPYPHTPIRFAAPLERARERRKRRYPGGGRGARASPVRQSATSITADSSARRTWPPLAAP
jgi:hypothetical protein